MMAAISLIAIVTILEARPVYAYLSATAFGTPVQMTDMLLGFGAAAALCIAATLVPIRVATGRLIALER